MSTKRKILIVFALLFFGLILSSFNSKTVEATKVGLPIKLVIRTPQDLETFRKKVNAGTTYTNYTVILANDIDMNGVLWDRPIGSGSTTDSQGNVITRSFKGTFEGNRHTIKNITIGADEGKLATNERKLGLFGTNRGTIQRLKVENIKIYGKRYKSTNNATFIVGGIAAINYGSILNSEVSGLSFSIVMSNNDKRSTNKLWCDKASDSPAGTLYMGGIAGYNELDGRIMYCSSTGTVNAYISFETPATGGTLDGYHCRDWKVMKVGGIIGNARSSKTRKAEIANNISYYKPKFISQCYDWRQYIVTFYKKDETGAYVRDDNGNLVVDHEEIREKYCYHGAQTLILDSIVGEIKYLPGHLYNNYYCQGSSASGEYVSNRNTRETINKINTQVVELYKSPYVQNQSIYDIDLTSPMQYKAMLEKEDSYIVGSVEDMYYNGELNWYQYGPELERRREEARIGHLNEKRVEYFTLSKDINDNEKFVQYWQASDYRILTPSDLKELSYDVNYCYSGNNVVGGNHGFGEYSEGGLHPQRVINQYNDLNMSKIEFEPIGKTDICAFKGLYDGKGYVIQGVKITDTSTQKFGLFGISRGIIQNVGARDIGISLKDNTKQMIEIGSIACENYGQIKYSYGQIDFDNYSTNTVKGGSTKNGVDGKYNFYSRAKGELVVGGLVAKNSQIYYDPNDTVNMVPISSDGSIRYTYCKGLGSKRSICLQFKNKIRNYKIGLIIGENENGIYQNGYSWAGMTIEKTATFKSYETKDDSIYGYYYRDQNDHNKFIYLRKTGDGVSKYNGGYRQKYRIKGEDGNYIRNPDNNNSTYWYRIVYPYNDFIYSNGVGITTYIGETTDKTIAKLIKEGTIKIETSDPQKLNMYYVVENGEKRYLNPYMRKQVNGVVGAIARDSYSVYNDEQKDVNNIHYLEQLDSYFITPTGEYVEGEEPGEFAEVIPIGLEEPQNPNDREKISETTVNTLSSKGMVDALNAEWIYYTDEQKQYFIDNGQEPGEGYGWRIFTEDGATVDGVTYPIINAGFPIFTWEQGRDIKFVEEITEKEPEEDESEDPIFPPGESNNFDEEGNDINEEERIVNLINGTNSEFVRDPNTIPDGNNDNALMDENEIETDNTQIAEENSDKNYIPSNEMPWANEYPNGTNFDVNNVNPNTIYGKNDIFDKNEVPSNIPDEDEDEEEWIPGPDDEDDPIDERDEGFQDGTGTQEDPADIHEDDRGLYVLDDNDNKKYIDPAKIHRNNGGYYVEIDNRKIYLDPTKFTENDIGSTISVKGEDKYIAAYKVRADEYSFYIMYQGNNKIYFNPSMLEQDKDGYYANRNNVNLYIDMTTIKSEKRGRYFKANGTELVYITGLYKVLGGYDDGTGCSARPLTPTVDSNKKIHYTADTGEVRTNNSKSLYKDRRGYYAIDGERRIYLKETKFDEDDNSYFVTEVGNNDHINAFKIKKDSQGYYIDVDGQKNRFDLTEIKKDEQRGYYIEKNDTRYFFDQSSILSDNRGDYVIIDGRKVYLDEGDADPVDEDESNNQGGNNNNKPSEGFEDGTGTHTKPVDLHRDDNGNVVIRNPETNTDIVINPENIRKNKYGFYYKLENRKIYLDGSWFNDDENGYYIEVDQKHVYINAYKVQKDNNGYYILVDNTKVYVESGKIYEEDSDYYVTYKNRKRFFDPDQIKNDSEGDYVEVKSNGKTYKLYIRVKIYDIQRDGQGYYIIVDNEKKYINPNQIKKDNSGYYIEIDNKKYYLNPDQIKRDTNGYYLDIEGTKVYLGSGLTSIGKLPQTGENDNNGPNGFIIVLVILVGFGTVVVIRLKQTELK